MATQAQVEELKGKMQIEREALITAARSLSPSDALMVPQNAEGEEQWTALEQLAHLWEMEKSYDAWVLAALRQDGIDLGTVTVPKVSVPIEAANNADVATMLRHLEVERAYTMGLIDAIPLEYYDRRASNAAFGSLTVLQWLRSFYRHDRQHAAQIQGRASDYKPSFVSGREPNQRQMRIDLVARRGAEGKQ